jgi:4-hydroxy-4-methyl-2-oxoglutarate aldolase
MTAISDFAQYGVATTYMAAGYKGLIDLPLIQIVPGTRVAGSARTVRCAQGDNLMVHAAIEKIKPDDVLVITMPSPAPVALMGELLATQARAHGAIAVLIDGAVRDTPELLQLGLPIWARWVRATQAAKDKPGALDVPVVIGGTTVNPGDIVVLDSDGAVAVAAHRAAEILQAAAALVAKERERRVQYQAGALSIDLMGLRPKLKGPRAAGGTSEG